MVTFMQTIMEFSQKNKELLGSTRSVISSDAFTTPTSLGAAIFSSSNDQKVSHEDPLQKDLSTQFDRP
jgi:hypothetical protein